VFLDILTKSDEVRRGARRCYLVKDQN